MFNITVDSLEEFCKEKSNPKIFQAPCVLTTILEGQRL